MMAEFLNTIENENDFLYIAKNKYFVDKTGLIEKFNVIMDEHQNRYICITRPRRFGKSINAFMLASYYSKIWIPKIFLISLILVNLNPMKNI